jgi:anti-sigma B factor antagonist
VGRNLGSEDRCESAIRLVDSILCRFKHIAASGESILPRWAIFMGKSFKYTYLDLQDAGEVLVVSFNQSSILDQQVIDQIGREFDQAELEAASNRKLLLNFHTVEYMSSAMLGKLIQLHKRCKADKIKLKLCGIAKNPLDVFKITKLDKLFEIHKDAPAALSTF